MHTSEFADIHRFTLGTHHINGEELNLNQAKRKKKKNLHKNRATLRFFTAFTHARECSAVRGAAYFDAF